jgi:hypothetical protein
MAFIVHLDGLFFQLQIPMDWKQQVREDFQCFFNDYQSKIWKEHQSIWKGEYSTHIKNVTAPVILLSAPPYKNHEADSIPLALYAGAIGYAPKSKVFMASTWGQSDLDDFFPTILGHDFDVSTGTVIGSFFDSNVYHSKQPRLDTERYIVESTQNPQFYLKGLDLSFYHRMVYSFSRKPLQFVWIGYSWNTNEPCPSNLTIIDLETISVLEGLEKIIALCQQK